MKQYHEIFKWSWHFTAATPTMASNHENRVTDDGDDDDGNDKRRLFSGKWKMRMRKMVRIKPEKCRTYYY